MDGIIKPGDMDWGNIPLTRQPAASFLKFLDNSTAEKKLPPIRDRIFSSELKSVANQVMAKTAVSEPVVALPSKPPSVEITDEEEIIQEPPAPEYSEIQEHADELAEILEFPAVEDIPEINIDKLWTVPSLAISDIVSRSLLNLGRIDNPVPSDFIILNRFLARLRGAAAMGWVLYDPAVYASRTYLDIGFDSYTRSNLFIGPSEAIVEDMGIRQYFKMGTTVKQNLHFRKRLSSHFLNRFRGIEIVNLKQYNMRGYVVLFYKNEPVKYDNKNENMFHATIRDMISFVNSFKRFQDYKSVASLGKGGSFVRLYRILKGALKESRGRLPIAYLTSQNISVHSAWKLMQQQVATSLLHVLDEEERVMIVAPGVLLTILINTSKEDLEAAVSRLNGNLGTTFELHFFQFPDLGYNILNYIYPGALEVSRL